MLNVIGRGKGAKLRIIPASGKGLRASSNIANPVPASTGWTEIAPGVWECDGVTVGAATTLILAQEADGLVIGQSYLLSATITGTADILIRSGSTTLDTNWDGSPKVFTPDNGNFNIFQRAGGYTIQSIVIREAAITALGVESVSEVGAPTVTILAPAATGVESVSEVGAPVFIVPAAIGVESVSEVGLASLLDEIAPTMIDDVYSELYMTFVATISEPAILHILVTDTEPTTADDIILGTGLLKTTIEVVDGLNNVPLEVSTVAAGTHWLGIIPVDASGNSDFAEAHVVQYSFAGGYVATGVESASEVGLPEPGVSGQTAIGVESASEVGSPIATIVAPAAVGVESSSEVGSPTAVIVAPAATGVESASEVGTPTAPAAGSAPTFHAISTAVGSAGAPVLAWPTGHAANDIGIIFTITRDNDTPGTPTDWTELLAANDGNKKVNIYWKRNNGSEGDVTIPDPGQYVWAQMMTIRGCVTGSTPVALLANDTLGSTSTSFTVPSGTTSGANRLVLAYCSSNEDEQYSSRLSTGFTNGNLTSLTNRMADHTGTGEGGGHYAATGTLASAGTTGTTTGTFAAACTQVRALLEFIGA